MRRYFDNMNNEELTEEWTRLDKEIEKRRNEQISKKYRPYDLDEDLIIAQLERDQYSIFIKMCDGNIKY
ncbi:MAG: hypothetical protein J6U54_12770 [Clostridiales bacterium]|nr:hypothetical protein [Clostridiales bacterium]